jgi:S1-C subfamily serine protease
MIVGRRCRACRLSMCAMISALSLSVTPAHGQQPDEFMSTIEKIKAGIAPVTCDHRTAPSRFNAGVHGTAFFTNAHGEFITAAHVIKGIDAQEDCERPALLVRVEEAGTAGIPNFYNLKFVASECRIDETADLARCKTVEDPTGIEKIVPKPTGLTVTGDIKPVGTPVAFTGFPVSGLTPHTARANIAGYMGIELTSKQGLPAYTTLVLDKSAWPGSSGGPVYGVDGRVMGVLLQTGSGLGFARHGARLSEFVNSP